MECSRVVDQCGSPARRIPAVQKILAQDEWFRRQGTMAAAWRTLRGGTPRQLVLARIIRGHTLGAKRKRGSDNELLKA